MKRKPTAEEQEVIDTLAAKHAKKPSKLTQVAKNSKRREMLDFARDNSLVIHPGRGYDYYADNYFEVGHCMCDSNRHDCPCPEAIEEVKRDGWCLCRLYWRDLDTYKNSHVKEE